MTVVARRRGASRPSAPRRRTVRLRLAQILVSNLIENAIRHNIPGGHIQATTGTCAGRATLTIANTGCARQPGTAAA